MQILKELNISPNNLSLYKTAFTHTSYSNEHINCESYERLEFLGDAVLELIISDYLYNERHLEEGTMTKMRSSYVCEEACATYSKELGFDKYIYLGSGETEASITILADVFESFIGATYLDQGFAFTSKLVLNIITKYINKEEIEPVKVIIKELSSSPIYETNLMSHLNAGVVLNDYELDGNNLKLNFNELLLSDPDSNKILEEVIY